MMGALLEIRDLSIRYGEGDTAVHAVRNVDIAVHEGEVLGIVGESGSGKSTLASAINGLLPDNAIVSGEILFKGQDCTKLSDKELRRLRATEISMIFQDPMSAFNPIRRVGDQIEEYIHGRSDLSGPAKRQAILEAFEAVGIPDPSYRLRGYPHEFSGGMRQRMAIAAALLVQPSLLLADEPTTALDVSLEAQMIHLLRSLREQMRTSIILVSHHLGVIAQMCDRVAVIYASEVVEQGTATEVFHRPSHPYTQALLACDPAMNEEAEDELLPTIEGEVPTLDHLSAGCVFAPRCPQADALCRRQRPTAVQLGASHFSRCHQAANREAG